ncbi:SecY-interacting protein [Thalassotalea ponticola]|uniref:SecY-interacting protein n=1 Tax=Thalassotalea ponticola TaxID=1523392 RepID=UPI0025B29307|nr:SecY-interacting protein [Thalassotalea ponticola]MDN3652594.1 SecY-interacting protein [Thalassotalea ponticola]
MSSLQKSLVNFANDYIAFCQQQHGGLPRVEHDPNWPSECEIGDVDGDNMSAWKPVQISDNLSFDNVESALGISLHPDIKQFFTAIYSEAIPCDCDEGALELLFAWSREDFDRLQQNLIGHVLMKRRLNQADTVFFAVTDAEEINLVIKNDSGEVWAEPVGLEPNKFVAESLEAFLAQLRYRAEPL